MEPYSEAVLRERGVDASGFVARELTAELVVRADLVLTATREHRAAVVGLVPAAVRRSFTLKEFARLSGLVRDAELARNAELARGLGSPTAEDLVSTASTRVDWAGRVRGLGDRQQPDADDIGDPIGAPLQIYVARAAEIDQACAQAVELLLGRERPSSPDR